MEVLKNNRMVEAQRKGLVHDDDDLVHSFCSSSSSSSSSSGMSNGSSIMESDSMEEETSSTLLPSSSNHHDSLSDMSSLLQQLPIKMGLSRHYEGKSRSFTSLANVRGLQDLAKEENPEKKKMKCCRRSYGRGGGLWRTNALSRNISKREWNSSRRRAPIPHPPPPPHRSTTTIPTISNQAPLLA